MKTKFVEACQDPDAHMSNHGKFMVARFDDDEWSRKSEVPTGFLPRSLLRVCGNGGGCFIVFDLQTGEGVMLQGPGYAKADLDKHRIWVCPLFEPFLVWLYQQIQSAGDDWFETLPSIVELPEAEFSLSGYRRPGPA